MKTIENHEEFRNNIKEELNKIILNDKIAINLEKAIYNYTVKEANSVKEIKKWNNPYFVKIYTNHFKRILINLNKNPNLLNDLKNNKHKPDTLGFMTHQELNPENWNKLIDKKIKRDKSKYETKQVAATDSFTCRKCKSKECNYYQMQTRSADEPMTTFVSCINCGNRWKC